MGFPIRKFTDQSLFAAPRDLSQRTTSFIASQRQGIHRMPLRHLIVLIFDAHPIRNVVERAHERCATSCALHGGVTVLRDPPHGIEAISKDQLASHIIRRRCGQAPTTGSTTPEGVMSRSVLRLIE